MIKDLEAAFEKISTKENKVEKTKQSKSPKEAYEAIKEYAKNGYDSITKEDKEFFLKCFGIFDRPATPKQFMMRVRIPGGQLTNQQAITIGEISKEFGNDYIDISTRAQIILRYLHIEDIPEILDRLKSVGITTFHTGVDNFRNFLNDPLDGLAYDNILPTQDLLLKIQDIFIKDFDWIAALPRKFNTGFCGSLSNRSNVFSQDLGYVLAQKDGIYGYNIYLGGRVGTIAKDADIFVSNEDEAIAVFKAIAELFRDYGFRHNRNKNRLQFLIEAVGIKALSEAIREKAGIDFLSAGETLTKVENIDPDQGRVQLRDGSFAVYSVVPSGVFKGSSLIEAAKLSSEYGDGRIRLDVNQSLYIIGVKKENYEALLNEDYFKVYRSKNTPYFNHLIACAGTDHCPFGVIPNKPDAIDMAEYLDKTVPLDSGRVRMYWSGCVKGCGIHGLGDIGFEGCKAKLEGKSVYGVHIFVGGKLIDEGREGYSVLKSIPLEYAKYFVAELVKEYKRLRTKDESFSHFESRVLSRYSNAAIGFMMQLKAYITYNGIDLDIGFSEDAKTAQFESFEIFDIGCKLYKKLTGITPYPLQEHFMPGDGEKLEEVIKIAPEVDENLAKLAYKMIHPKANERAKVFSELGDFVAIYTK